MKTYILALFFLLSSFSVLRGQETTSLHKQSYSLAPENDPLLDEPFHIEETNTPEDFQARFFKMLIILGLLIGFMFLAAWMIRRMTHTRLTQINTTSAIKVLEVRQLSPRATVYLIEVAGEGIVIAESHQNVSYLTKVPLLENEEKTFNL